MHQPKSNRKRQLEIQVSFEVSRLSHDYLANAYEQIVPPICRTTSIPQPSSVIDLNSTSHCAGDQNHECS